MADVMQAVSDGMKLTEQQAMGEEKINFKSSDCTVRQCVLQISCS